MIHFFLILFFITIANADPGKGLVSGDKAAHSFLNTLGKDKRRAENHPFYQGIPSESNLNDKNLTQKSNLKMGKDPSSQMIVESEHSRQKFKIDPQNDPLMTNSQKVLADPLQTIGGKGTRLSVIKQGGADSTLTCEESGDEVEYTCKSDLIVTINTEKGPLIKGSLSYGGPEFAVIYGSNLNLSTGYTTFNDISLKQFVSNRTGIPLHKIVAAQGGAWGVQHRESKMTTIFDGYYFDYSYQNLIKVPAYSWSDGCGALEKRADANGCRYISKECTKGPETRVIDGMSIKKDCWQYTYTYACSHPSKNNCGPLRARGCTQIKSSCKEKVGKTCVNYLQTYQCKSNLNSAYMEVIKGGKAPFCLDGNCRDQSWESNDEMMSSIAQLSLLKEMQGQFKNGLLFKGEDKRCSKYILSFKDCCGTDKGWGKDLGLASCKAGEKDLSQKRKKGLCHFVGTYCAKKVLGQCVKKKSSYCCFTNKLLKAFHVQGRPQIGLGWGDPKEPICRGFTVEEIQRIDFSKLDLREVFEEIMQNFKESKANTKDMGRKINDRMKTIQKGIRPNSKVPPKQRNDA